MPISRLALPRPACTNSIAFLVAILPWPASIQRPSCMEAWPLTIVLQVLQDKGTMYSSGNKPATEARPLDVRVCFV